MNDEDKVLLSKEIKNLRLDVADEIADLRAKMDYDKDGDVDAQDLTKWVAANPKKAALGALVVMVVLAILL